MQNKDINMLSGFSRLRISQQILNSNSKFLTNVLRYQSTSSSSESTETTSFGFKEVKIEEKQKEVNKVFNNVAEKYDVMNDIMSFGLHRVWKNYLIEEINPNYQMKLIDVAGGTGDIAFRFLNHLENSTNENISPKSP